MARILLAEDDAATRDMVQRALALDGHEVTVTQDGTEALEKLQAAPGRIDLMITDVQMPGLDGVALVEKALAAAPKLRVVLMSGFADELGRAAHLKAKISAHHHQAVHAGADPGGGEGGAGVDGLACPVGATPPGRLGSCRSLDDTQFSCSWRQLE